MRPIVSTTRAVREVMAECQHCSWHRDSVRPAATREAARRHAHTTGHRVRVETTSAVYLEATR